MDNNNPCIFCDKDNKRFTLITENDFCYAIWDSNPVSQGHALVIPKSHTVSFFDLHSKDVESLFSLMGIVKNIISQEYNPEGFTIGVNDGVSTGRTVHHLHIHIIPRYVGDVADPRGGVRHIIPGKGFY